MFLTSDRPSLWWGKDASGKWGNSSQRESGERPRLRLLTRRSSVRVLFAEPNAFHRTLPSFWFTDYSAISPENGQYSTDLALSGRMQLTGKAAESAALWESADQFLTFSKLAGLLVNGRAQAIRAISTQAWRGDSAIRADLVVGVAGKFHKLFFERGC